MDQRSDQLEGQEFIALNGGPHFKFTEAISLHVTCEDAEGDRRSLEQDSARADRKGQCGWLKDKFGLSWQIDAAVLIRMLQDKDPQKSKRVMEAMLQMKKMDIARLEQVYNQR